MMRISFYLPLVKIQEMIFLVQDVKVAFFAEGTDAEDAKAAGADVVGGLELIEEILSN